MEEIWLKLKANWDAYVGSHAINIGGVVWNSKGEVLALFYILQLNIHSPKVTKAFALRKIMHICSEMGFIEVRFKGDSQTVMKVAKSEADDISKLGAIMYDVQFYYRRTMDRLLSLILEKQTE